LPIQDILIGKDNIQPALNMALEGVPTLNLEVLRLYRRSGEAFQARVNILPVKEKDLVEGVIILVRDLSDQEIAKSHAEQLEQHALLGTVTAIFAHEVRNPINNISTGLQLMAYNLQPGDPQLELITKLQQDCDRLEELMKSVLSFARATEYEMEPVDLGLLVSRLIDRLRPKIAAAGIDHRINASPETPLVMGNPRALEQVFNNLINNAIQAMEKAGGILAIKVQPSETTGKRQNALVIVADNGPGIPKENQDKIFTPFFTTKSSGTGLGLAITKRIVTAHKGTILLNSFPGGTVFTVQIPAIEKTQDEI
jgi:two-component system, NtrC family, sensor histidine kinase AtoS